MVGVTLELRPPDEREDDRHSIHSIASTVATTTSLASRIRDLNLFEEVEKEAEKDGDRTLHSPLPEDPEEEHAETSGNAADEEECGRAGPLSEEDLSISHSLHLLHRDPPLQVCSRLFERRSHPPLPLKRMTMLQVEDFRQHGYVVIDNFISKEAAARIKAEALRLSQKGLLQPVSPASLGIIAQQTGNLSTPIPRLQQLAPSSSPRSTCSSYSQQSSQPITVCTSPNGYPCSQQQQQCQHQGSSQQQQQQQQQQWGELRMPLALGQPPADTAVFAPVMAALQDLQDDLCEFVRLRDKGSAEYCLSQLPAGTATVPRHIDALPDDGRGSSSSSSNQPHQQQQQPNGIAEAAVATGNTAAQQQQQQQNGSGEPAAASSSGSSQVQQNGSVDPSPAAGSSSSQVQQKGTAESAAAAASADSSSPLQPQQQQQQGQLLLQGQLSRRVTIFVFLNADWDREHGGGLRLWPPQRPVGPSSTAAASGAARRSPTSSDAGTTFSEISDCGSLRTPWLGSTTSSVIAEASAPDHDTYSLDGMSVAESEAERQGFEWVECEGGEMALDVAPLAGRVLIGLSGALEHALLPSSGQGSGSDMVFVRAWCG